MASTPENRSNSVGTVGSDAGTCTRTRMRRGGGVGNEVDHDLESFTGNVGRQRAVRVGQIISTTQVDDRHITIGFQCSDGVDVLVDAWVEHSLAECFGDQYVVHAGGFGRCSSLGVAGLRVPRRRSSVQGSSTQHNLGLGLAVALFNDDARAPAGRLPTLEGFRRFRSACGA